MSKPFIPAAAASHPWQLNTSNPSKIADYRDLMSRHGLILAGQSRADLREVDADPLTVLVHKASQFDHDWVLVDDGSFEVEGCDIGVNIRWLVDALPGLAGRPASMQVMVGFRERGQIIVSQGLVTGFVVAPRGEGPAGFSVLPYFQPNGRTHTLAEHRDDAVNPRAQAVGALARGDFVAIAQPITTWDGPWQGEAAPA